LSVAATPSEIGPKDAYLANLSAVQCRVQFRLSIGSKDSSRFKDPDFWSRIQSVSEPPQGYPIEMFWASDGTNSLLEYRPEEADSRPNIPRLKIGLDSIPRPFQQLHATDFTAFLPIPSQAVSVMPGHVFDSVQSHPFCWGPNWLVLHDIAQHFPKHEPQRFPDLRDGRPLIVEVYTRDLPTPGWHQLEIWYDPNTGYLPRHIRAAVFEKPILYVQEYRLLQTQTLDSGGFLPTQWMCVQYQLPDYANEANRYRYDTNVTPPSGLISLTTYEALSVKPWREPVALHDLQSVRVLGSPGGQVDMPKNQDTLTAEDIRRLLGSRIFQKSNQLGMNVDVADLEKYSNRTRPPNHWPWILGAFFLALLTATAFVLFKKRYTAVLILLAALPALGCESPATSLPRLALSLDPELSITDANPTTLQLQIQNLDHRSLQIFQIDGGCGCRQVDPARLPATLKPREILSVPISLSHQQSDQARQAVFTLNTNRGTIANVVKYHSCRNSPSLPLRSHSHRLTKLRRPSSMWMSRPSCPRRTPPPCRGPSCRNSSRSCP
jgi:hypothetical protein